MRRTIRYPVLMLALALAASCSSPGSNVVVEGTYTGTILQSPRISITLVISGNNITGTGVVQPDAANLWRGDPAETIHITFAGTRSGRQIVTLTSTVSHIQYNTNPFGTATWIDAGVTMSLARDASVNDNNGITGLWQGSSTAVSNQLGGSWSAVRTGGSAAGLVRP